MYGCNRHIECISVTAYEIGTIPKVSVDCLDSEPLVSVKLTSDTPKTFVECLDSPIFVSVNPINDKIKVSCSVICSINMTPFVMVNPTYIWLTPEMLASEEFDITSNTSWTIE